MEDSVGASLENVSAVLYVRACVHVVYFTVVLGDNRYF